MEFELHDFDNKFKQDFPEEEETSFINQDDDQKVNQEDFDQDVENSLLSPKEETSFINPEDKEDQDEDFKFHLMGLKENMGLVDKRKRLKEYTGLDIDPKKGRFSKALLEDIEFTWRDDQGWSGILYRNKPVYRMSRGDMIPLSRSRIYPQFKMAVDLARDEEQKEELENWLESRLKSIEDQLDEQDIKELKNITSVETLEEKTTEYRKLKHTEEDNEDYKLLEEYTLLLSDQLRIENNQEPEEHETIVEQKKLELLRKLKQSLIKYLPYGVLTGVITTIGYIIDYTIGSKSKIGVGAYEIKDDHDEKIKQLDQKIKEIKEKQKSLKITLDENQEDPTSDIGGKIIPKEEKKDNKEDKIIINSVKSKTNPDKNLKTYTIEKKGETSEEYLKRRRKERREKLDKILNDPSTKLDVPKSQKTDLGFPVDPKKQESISIGKTVVILGATAVGGVTGFYFAMVPAYAFTSFSVFEVFVGHKAAWITYSAAAYGATISGIKMNEFITKITKENKETEQILENVGTSLMPVGKPTLDFWYWIFKFTPNSVLRFLKLGYKIISTLINLITNALSIPILKFLNSVLDHFTILLFCVIVFYFLFNQGGPFDLILLIVICVFIFIIIYFGYKMKNYFYPPLEEE